MNPPSSTKSVVRTAATGEPSLNSDLIRERFGSYHVDVLRRSDDTRVSALSSEDNGERVCRTFAVTQFMPLNRSIGATLRGAGFEVDKRSLDITTARLEDSSHAALERMHLEAPATLAMHIYSLGIRDKSTTSPFAIIAELHHPEFLVYEDLRELFSVHDKVSGDSIDLDRLRAEIFHIGT